jgi:hypothetical protein
MHDAIRIANPELPIDQVFKQSEALTGYVDQVVGPILALLVLWIAAFVVQALSIWRKRKEAEQAAVADLADSTAKP